MTDDLVHFLRARLDEDEQAARAAHEPNWLTDGRRGLRYGMDDSWMTDALTTADADHIARHDPARVLREVEAKRGVLNQYDDVRGQARNPVSAENRHAARIEQGALGDVMRLLALPYADHLDYREDWKP